MAYLDQLAELPEKNITYLKKKETYYVIYNYDYKRNANGNPESKKIMIGKLIDKEARIFQPNENYLKVFPEAKFIKKKAENNVPLSAVKYIKPEGLLQAVSSISVEVKLEEVLEEVFGRKREVILTLASYMLCCGNVMKGYERWAKKHYLDPALCLNERQISEIFNRVITQEKIAKFLDFWFSKVKTDRFLAYNYKATYPSLHSIEADRRFGFNQDRAAKRENNLGVIFDEDSRLPLTYTFSHGNISDKTYLSFILGINENLKGSKFTFVMEQNYFSTNNLKEISTRGNSFITVLPRDLKLAKEAIAEVSKKVLGYEDLVPGFKAVKYKAMDAWLNNSKCKLYVFLDPDERVELQAAFEEYLEQEEEELQDAIAQKTVVPNSYKYFKISQDRNQEYKYEKDIEQISADYSQLGYFILVSNNLETTAGEVLA
ncbi:hypothetical protein CKF54_02070 [Psittacicella hinzii]|uniref:Transposase IS4-like domain-containing protein n=1 Tax=Psittacicella hinzii TaxID=2028575 RepID=A0A3A1Y936_9GAMM|nr:hypothetical protein [Psittacicella hinzii]RIY33836.1 hypothetical protein CKF54_02070 [Psittacicella hinzii]